MKGFTREQKGKNTDPNIYPCNLLPLYIHMTTAAIVKLCLDLTLKADGTEVER